MPTFILVLKGEAGNSRWLARKWGTDPAVLTASCNYDPSVNRLFDKNPNDKKLNCPCTKLVDPLGNQSDVIMLQLVP